MHLRFAADEPMAPALRSKTARAAALLEVGWLRRMLTRVASWHGVLVLNYHRVGDATGQPGDRRVWSTAADAFEEQLALLTAHTEIIGPDELAARVSSRRGRSVMLTFDDGYRDNYEIAYPLLARYGVPATFFLVSGFLDQPRIAWWDEIAWMVRHGGPADGEAAVEASIASLIASYKRLPGDRTEAFLDRLSVTTGSGRFSATAPADAWMTWDMARELRAHGMAIGGHTVNHHVLARLTAAEQEDEIGTCARRMREELGEPMRWFSYPVGSRDSFDADTRAILRRHEVELAFSFYGGFSRFARWDPLDVRRIHVGPSLSRQVLEATVRAPQLFARPAPR